jgi:hypothetical protein
MHPKMHNGDSFGIFDSIGYHPFSQCCQSPITPLAKELGIGPSLFLLSTKSLAYLFLILTIINIPVYIFFW